MATSVAIMAHYSRIEMVGDLLDRLGDSRIDIVWDRHDNEWDTGRRALLAYKADATHHIVIQDDAIPCRDFLAGADQALAYAGDRPVGFYIGNPRIGHRDVGHIVRHAVRVGATWLQMPGPWWGVAVAVPTAHIEELVAWGDRNPENVRDYDKRITRWYMGRGTECWYTLPSLVDHRPGPSLLDHEGRRQAYEFIGDRSALRVDWGGPVVNAIARFHHPVKRSTYQARIGTARYHRMVNDPALEQFA